MAATVEDEQLVKSFPETIGKTARSRLYLTVQVCVQQIEKEIRLQMLTTTKKLNINIVTGYCE